MVRSETFVPLASVRLSSVLVLEAIGISQSSMKATLRRNENGLHGLAPAVEHSKVKELLICRSISLRKSR